LLGVLQAKYSVLSIFHTQLLVLCGPCVCWLFGP
jgi:hypothetical protein